MVLAVLCLFLKVRGQENKTVQRPQPTDTIKKAPKRNLQDTTFQLQEVKVNTGYQNLNKDKTTGSFVFIDSALLNRRVGTGLLERLDGITSGLLFNKNTGSTATTNASQLAIRGRSTIYANPNPLIVVDNFPFNGDVNTLNPDDIENITILKDAAAAAIWGAFSGNGVIVITTKKGRYNKPVQIAFNGSVTVGQSPNAWYAPRLGSANAVDVEEFLFNKGYFNGRLNSSARPVLSPVVEVLAAKRNGQLTAADSASLINAYKNTDTRQGLEDYFYRNTLEQRYGLSISGGTATNSYYLGGGFDKSLTGLKGTGFNRISLHLSNNHQLLDGKLALSYTIAMTSNQNQNNGMATGGTAYPYVSFVNTDGTYASLPNGFRKTYIDTLGAGALLDWRYRPLQELHLNDNTATLNEYRFNGKVSYRLPLGLELSVRYQYNTSLSKNNVHYQQESFYVRNYINQYTQYNAATQTYTQRLPLGGILDQTNNNYQSHNGRLQLDYNRSFAAVHTLNAIAGIEQRWINSYYTTQRLYGYNGDTGTASLDFATNFVLLPNNGQGQIANNVSQLGTSGRFRSAFANVNYALSERYQLSASLRKDQSNIFGVSTNQKGVPLWSVGAAWEINKENFYQLQWLPYLKLRLSNGYQGNTDASLSAMVTATINPLTVNYYNMPYAVLSNPPNERLRWEKVNTLNAGIDFKLLKALSGSIDFYTKHGKDLIGITNVDPTTGVSTFKGNVADMQGKGIDIVLNSNNTNGGLKWQTTLLWSYTKDKVTNYSYRPTTVNSAINASISPMEGFPLYAIYALPWAGLDNVGDPLVYLDGQPSKNYGNIYNSPNLDNLKYIGPKNPPVFGALRNDFQWKAFNLSVNVTYKFGHYFRRQGLGYADLVAGNTYFSNEDYNRRWQKTGDENLTDVPAFAYPVNATRDAIYRNADILVEKADHIRLQDISLGYTVKRQKWLPFSTATVYAYANNLGLLWKATKTSIDPDMVPVGGLVYPKPTTYALGLKVSF